MSEPSHEPKIIVDSDWKQEAAQEKRRLEEQTKRAPQPGPLPPPNFFEIVNLLVMQASVGLGGFKTPNGETMPPDLVMAKYFIDLVEVLQDKTKGNLTAEEKRAMDAVLYELRLRYVHAATPSPGGAPPPDRD